MKHVLFAERHKKEYRRLLAALLAAIFLLNVACTTFSFEQTGPAIVINEVVTSNGDSLEDEALGSPDWIELKNIGTVSVSLLGYRVTDNIQKAEKAYLLPDVTLAPGEFLVLYATKDEKTDTLSYEGGPICLGFSLKASGENLALEDANMQLLQELTVPPMDRDVSYARRSDGSFGYCGEPTPNGENVTTIYSSLDDVPRPAEEEPVERTTSVTGLYFSEVSARNNQALVCTGCSSCDWIELYNATDAPIVLDGFSLGNDVRDNDKANLSGTVPAGGYLVIYCCTDECVADDGHVCVPMGVSRYGESLYLFDAEGLQCAFLDVPETPAKDVSYMLSEDGEYRFTATATPGRDNVYTEYVPPAEEPEDVDKDDDEPDALYMGLASRVIINEVLPSNGYSIADRDGDRSDWVELYNPGDTAVNLEGWYLSDANRNLRKWAFPAVSIPAKGYLIVFLSGKESNESELHANFSLTEGETIKLYNSADNTYDAVEISVSRSNLSIGRDESGTIVYYWEPTPLAPNGHARYEADSLGFFQPDSVIISEVSAVHARGSEEEDWIEIYNGSSSSVNLSGYCLTDDIDEPNRYRFGSTVLGANEYTVVTVNRYAGSFSVTPGGETLYLIKPDGVVTDAFDTGVVRVGMTSGRIVNDPSIPRVFFDKATKGKANNSSYSVGYTSEPTFSETALYYTDPFTLTLSDLQSDAAIYYTTDGSEPTAKSKRYTEPLTISKNTVIRAFAVSDGLMDSEIITYTYLFEEPHTLPVVCLSMAPNDLKTVWNVKQHSDIKERKGFATYYESDGLVGTSFPCDVKAKGQGTLKYISQRSLTLSLRAEYGQRTVTYPFWDDYPYTEFGAFALRQAGQDYNLARMRDAFISRASIGLNVDTANSRFCILYINGAYYGIYDFNEELNSRYLETHYGVDPDTVNTILRNGKVARKGTTTEWKKVFDGAKSANLKTQEKYDTFCEKVDADYVIDYIIVRTFMRDSDMFNQKYWRTTDYQLKWRPILYDMDYALSTSAPNGNMMHNYFDKSGTPSNNGSLTYFYLSCALRTNADWSERFVERYVEIVMTWFTADRLVVLIDQMEAELEPEMARHVARWKYPSSVSTWKKEVQKLRELVVHRTEIILEQVRKEFGLSTVEMNALIEKYRQ